MLEFAKEWHWIVKALGGMITFVPFLVLVPILVGKFGVKIEGVFIVWFCGCFLGFLFWGGISSNPLISYIPQGWPLIVLFILAFVVGSTGNIFVIQSMNPATCPHPGIALTVVNLGGVVAYLVSFWGHKFFPKNFQPMTFNWVNFTGMILAVVVIVMISYQPKIEGGLP